MLKNLSILILIATLTGCMPSEINITNPDGKKFLVSFYPGGTELDDLIIINGKNYFGKAQYQMNDKMGDIGFRTKEGLKVLAECKDIGKDILGESECKTYIVFRSNIDAIKQGATITKSNL
jgi:hypothetical protein